MDELKAIREYVSDIPEMKSTLQQMNNRLEHVETDMGAVKALLRIHDEEIKLNDGDIKRIKERVGIVT